MEGPAGREEAGKGSDGEEAGREERSNATGSLTVPTVGGGVRVCASPHRNGVAAEEETGVVTDYLVADLAAAGNGRAGSALPLDLVQNPRERERG